MRNLSLFVLLCAFIFSPEHIYSQDVEEYIYGKITTHSGEEYIGFMRWGKEEVFWHDIFNSEKVDDKHYKFKKEDTGGSRWMNFDWNWSSLWDDKYSHVRHSFACFFGDIKSIHPGKDSRVDLELKDGTIIKLKGGSNDIGGKIKMTDYELGQITFDWSKIERIDFNQASSRVEQAYAPSLYGTVHTRRNGSFKGYIKWDLDERTTDDILDGDSSIGDQKIPFRNISSITKEENGAFVKMNSGREIFLKGSNDVNSSSRGIAVYSHEIGSVEISWRDFISAQFEEAPASGPGYNDFPEPEGLSATVTTFNNNSYEGMLVFDVDELFEIEFLDGKDDLIEYQIPLRNIHRIIPKNRSFSLVELRNGEKLLLGDTQDVSSKNDGVLIFEKSKKDPHYIAWDDIDMIQIHH
ncbi:MAG: hypothetical protein HKN67_06615 [Saprospiraceae bacterium]|nr:hypothetical protein [Bacteroidia bacterium]MBT8230418.1 hypothetical protein [Bacteroidia bacterium]NNF21594.1 hypothetical protein [Saprospiraceae bacterium]